MCYFKTDSSVCVIAIEVQPLTDKKKKMFLNFDKTFKSYTFQLQPSKKTKQQQQQQNQKKKPFYFRNYKK